MTVTQLLDNTDADEISEWMAFFDMEDPELAAWQRTSLLAANLTNIANLRGQHKYPEKVRADHFMPNKKQRIQTPKAQVDTLKALFPSR